MGEEDTKLQLEESMDAESIQTAEDSSSKESSAPGEKLKNDVSDASESQAENAAQQVKKSGGLPGGIKKDPQTPTSKKSKNKSILAESKVVTEESDADEDVDTSKENINDSAELMASGKRDRKKVERLSFSAPEKNKSKIEAMGAGLALGEDPYIEHMFTVTKPDDLKFLHMLLYRRGGNKNEIKRNLRCFNGFSFSKEDEEFQSLVTRITKWPMKPSLSKALSLLGQSPKGSKQEVAERLAEFLLCPTTVEKGVPGKKRRKSASKKKSSPTRKVSKTKRKSVGKKPSKDSDSQSGDDAPESKAKGRHKSAPKKPQYVSDEDDDDENDDDQMSEESDNDDDNNNSSSEKEEEDPAQIPKAKPAALTKTAKKVTSTPSQKRKKKEDSDDETDDEPLVKKVKKSEPTDGDIKDFLKGFIQSVDLEEVTMKSIYQKVYDQYPEADLTSRKEFIKETVKKMLA